MSRLTPNYPPLVNKNCDFKSNCGCEEKDIDFGNIFSEDALYKLNKSDDLCDAYDKINANFKMLADGFLLLAKSLIQRERVVFGENIPGSFQGNFFYHIGTQKLFVWNDNDKCYVAANGCHSIGNTETDKRVGEEFFPDNTVPNLKNLRNISDGIEVNTFTNCYGAQEVVFTNGEPSCGVGLFIYDKEDNVLKIWSEEDQRYIPAYGCLSIDNPYEKKPTQEGPVTSKVQIEK